MSRSRKLNPETAGTRRQRATAHRLFLQFDISPDQPPRVVEETRRATEFHEDIVTRVRKEWQACRSQLPPERPAPVGRVTVDVHLAKRPTRLSQAEGLQFLNEVAACVGPIFRGAAEPPPPINLPFARGGLTFQPSPATPNVVLARDAGKAHDSEDVTSRDDGLSVAEDVKAGDGAPSPPSTKAAAIRLEQVTRAYQQATARVDAASRAVRAEAAARLQPHLDAYAEHLNAYIKSLPQGTIGEKRSLARWVNDELRPRGLALKCPNTGAASLLQIDPGDYPDVGRFQFYHYEGGKQLRTASRTELPDVEVVSADLSQSLREGEGQEAGWAATEEQRREGPAHTIPNKPQKKR